MNKYIRYINKKLKEVKSENISIHTGKLSKILKNELEKHFKVTPEYFGYTMFEKISKKRIKENLKNE